MDIQLDKALLLFADWVIGRTVRGQKVSSVELTIDTLSQPETPLRYILTVVFTENPPAPDNLPEESLLERVFSDIPDSAHITTPDVQELRARLVGLRPCFEYEWILSDEAIDGSK